MLELKFLGVGDSESLAHYNTNILIVHRSRRLLVDCGWTAKKALHENGLAINDIEAVFVTHVHGDHVFGLERFGFEARYVLGGHRIRLVGDESVLEVLWRECLKGCMGYSSSGENGIEDFFDVRLVKDGAFEWADMRFEVFPTPHTKGKPSFGIRLPGRFVFTSDSNVIPGLDKIAGEDEVIFHDACITRKEHPAHATVDEMRRCYSEALRKRIFLMHYEDAFIGSNIDLGDFAGVVKQGDVFRW